MLRNNGYAAGNLGLLLHPETSAFFDMSLKSSVSLERNTK